MSLSKIMVVIDPLQEEQATLKRGLQSAVITGAKLHLFVCINDQAIQSREESLSEEQILAAFNETLEGYVKQAAEQGIQSTAEVVRADDWPSEIVRSASKHGCDMIFKSSYYHNNAERALQNTSDWILMRSAPCPVLMVKNFHDWSQRKVLATLKYDNEDAAHKKLNQSIINITQRMADAHGSQAHFISAYQDKTRAPEKDELVDECGVAAEQIHIIKGAPVDTIVGTAKDLDVDLIIVGTVARTGMIARVVGNTSEKLLDQTHADVLVINN